MAYPIPPVSPRPRRRWWLPVAFVGGAGVLVGGTLLISNTFGHPTATAAATTPTPPPTSTTVDTPTTTVADVAVTPGQVDAVIASDGHPLDLAGGMTPYPDAYALIKDDCDTMASQPIATDWLAAHMLNAAVPGEAAAIRVGVPLVCPQFSPAVLAVEGGTGG